MRRICAAALLAAFLLPPAGAQRGFCMMREEAVAFLAGRFGETLIAAGRIGDIAAFELFAAPSGTWTVVTTDTRGVSCMVLSGDGFSPVRPAEPEEKPS